MSAVDADYGRHVAGVVVGPEVAEELVSLWQRAGQPSSRTLAPLAGCSHSVVAEALSGRRMPSLKTLLRIVDALEGDGQYFIDLYARYLPRQAETSAPPPPTNRELLTTILAELRAISAQLDRRE